MMRNRKFYLKFKLAGNDNTYFASSLKALNHFLKKTDLALIGWHTYLPFSEERKKAIHVDWGVWCIPDNN